MCRAREFDFYPFYETNKLLHGYLDLLRELSRCGSRDYHPILFSLDRMLFQLGTSSHFGSLICLPSQCYEIAIFVVSRTKSFRVSIDHCQILGCQGSRRQWSAKLTENWPLWRYRACCLFGVEWVGGGSCWNGPISIILHHTCAWHLSNLAD